MRAILCVAMRYCNILNACASDDDSASASPQIQSWHTRHHYRFMLSISYRAQKRLSAEGFGAGSFVQFRIKAES